MNCKYIGYWTFVVYAGIFPRTLSLVFFCGVCVCVGKGYKINLYSFIFHFSFWF